MLLASLIIAPLFTAGFALMLRELVKAPQGYQDELGFHKLPASQQPAAARVKSKKERTKALGHPSFEGFRAAHAR